MEQVKCVTDPKLYAMFPRHFPVWTEVETKDGRTLRSELTWGLVFQSYQVWPSGEL